MTTTTTLENTLDRLRIDQESCQGDSPLKQQQQQQDPPICTPTKQQQQRTPLRSAQHRLNQTTPGPAIPTIPTNATTTSTNTTAASGKRSSLPTFHGHRPLRVTNTTLDGGSPTAGLDHGEGLSSDAVSETTTSVSLAESSSHQKPEWNSSLASASHGVTPNRLPWTRELRMRKTSVTLESSDSPATKEKTSAKKKLPSPSPSSSACPKPAMKSAVTLKPAETPKPGVTLKKEATPKAKPSPIQTQATACISTSVVASPRTPHVSQINVKRQKQISQLARPAAPMRQPSFTSKGMEETKLAAAALEKDDDGFAMPLRPTKTSPNSHANANLQTMELQRLRAKLQKEESLRIRLERELEAEKKRHLKLQMDHQVLLAKLNHKNSK